MSGHQIDLGNRHTVTAAHQEGRIRIYASIGGQLTPAGAHLDEGQARELAAALLVLADSLDPPVTTATAASTLGSPTMRAEMTFTPPKGG